MTDQEREYIIEKKEECKKKYNGVKTNFVIPAMIFTMAFGISAINNSMEVFDSSSVHQILSTLSSGLYGASFLHLFWENDWNKFRKKDLNNQIEDYNKLLNGLENEQSQEIEKEGKSR